VAEIWWVMTCYGMIMIRDRISEFEISEDHQPYSSPVQGARGMTSSQIRPRCQVFCRAQISPGGPRHSHFRQVDPSQFQGRSQAHYGVNGNCELPHTVDPAFLYNLPHHPEAEGFQYLCGRPRVSDLRLEFLSCLALFIYLGALIGDEGPPTGSSYPQGLVCPCEVPVGALKYRSWLLLVRDMNASN